MRFPGFGNVHIPSQEKGEALPIKDDIEIKNKLITELLQKIVYLGQKLEQNGLSEIEKQEIQREIVLAKIDLTEAETERDFLTEELS